MDLDESRLPLDPGAVLDALGEQGWAGPSPRILESPAAEPGASVALLSGVDRRDLASVVVGEGDVTIGSFTLIGLPPGSSLAVSMLATGSPGQDGAGWLTLLGALAAADALRAAARVPAEVSWPDSITVRGAMCGGEAGSLQVGAVRTDPVEDGHVVTVVIAVGISAQRLPARTSSLYSEGGSIDRVGILGALLPALARRIEQWRDGDAALLTDYHDRCQTLGRPLDLPVGRGPATGVDRAGSLVVMVDGLPRTLGVHEATPVIAGT